MSKQLYLKIQTRHEELEDVATAVEEFGTEEDWPLDLVFKVNLVLEEIVINVMNYAHDEGLHPIEITLTSAADSLTIEVVDDGRPFDPLTDAPEPNTTADLQDRNVGGLGVHFVREMMDDVSYRREDGKNRLTMVALLANRAN